MAADEPHAAVSLFETLTLLGAALDGADSVAARLASVAEEARALLPFTATALALATPDGWQVWRGRSRPPFEVSHNATIPAPAAETLARFVGQDAPLRIDDLLAAPWRDTAHRDVLWKVGTRSALLIPLGAARRGALSFTDPQPDRYDDAHMARARHVAWMVGHSFRQEADG